MNDTELIFLKYAERNVVSFSDISFCGGTHCPSCCLYHGANDVECNNITYEDIGFLKNKYPEYNI